MRAGDGCGTDTRVDGGGHPTRTPVSPPKICRSPARSIPGRQLSTSSTNVSDGAAGFPRRVAWYTEPMSSDPLRPTVIVFDVNETLSDMSTMSDRFVEVGAPGELASTWFTGVLRDGFALTASGTTRGFADIGAGLLRVLLPGLPLNRSLDDAVEHIIGGMVGLGVHSDVVLGIEALSALGIRLITLSNGGTHVAEKLLTDAGVRDRFAAVLSVDAAGKWKPHADAYAYALTECGVDPGEAMLVAVHPWDIDGASRAGMRTAWLNRENHSYPDYFTEPTVAAPTLLRLAEQMAHLTAKG